ncbi:phosphatases ii [Ceraceosorus bombacis]|uniref:Phosphatases ii n=1 Tax=Ceraceosorus bombacis TaxID=401625 RepID=A0A0P1BFG1_9BASI|nr:phosphatases ii [Ceraceosorus bombacis]
MTSAELDRTVRVTINPVPPEHASDGETVHAIVPLLYYNVKTGPTYEQRDRLLKLVWQLSRKGGHEYWVHLLDLSRLASQHHLSPYSQLKHGARGSPYGYVPFTMLHPRIVDATLRKQEENEAKSAAWLLSKRQRRHDELRAAAHQRASESPTSSETSMDLDKVALSPPCGIKRPHSASSARDESARTTPRLATAADLTLSTSLGAQARQGDQISPNGMGQSHQSVSSPRVGSTESGGGLGLQIGEGSNSQAQTPPEARAGSQVAVAGPLACEVLLTQESEQRRGENGAASSVNDATRPTGVTVASMSQEAQQALAMKTSDTHPITISPIIPPDMLAEISQIVLNILPACVDAAFKTPEERQKTLKAGHTSPHAGGGALHEVPTPSVDARDVHVSRQARGEKLLRLPPSLDMVQVGKTVEKETIEAAKKAYEASQPSRPLISATANGTNPVESAAGDATLQASGAVAPAHSAALPEDVQAQARAEGQAEAKGRSTEEEAHRPSMGNMLLSSCPGKKVRLTGPVRGRGAICRDLGLDLKRIRGLGVGVVVCCLDDTELAFLGAPWEEYEREADQLGMDVVRLPMAEGFAPTCAKTIDAAMTSIVSDYTLKGVHVLVHCRGGVGRAGLIACTWMYKLGLVGSKCEALATAPARAANEASADSTESDAERLISTVERLIETIRRRRSPKAIETAEQVAFIVEYVNYIHRQEHEHARLSCTDSMS